MIGLVIPIALILGIGGKMGKFDRALDESSHEYNQRCNLELIATAIAKKGIDSIEYQKVNSGDYVIKNHGIVIVSGISLDQAVQIYSLICAIV